MAAHDDLSLMGLPLEIRQSIWAFALKHTTSMRPCLGWDGRYTPLSRIVTVMCVSKQVYAETKTIFYAVNCFQCRWDSVANNFILGPAFDTDLEVVSMKKYVSLIQHIVIEHTFVDIEDEMRQIEDTVTDMDMNGLYQSGSGNTTMLNLFEHLMRESTHLKSLTMWMFSDPLFLGRFENQDDWDKRWTLMHGLKTLVGILEEMISYKPAMLIKVVFNDQFWYSKFNDSDAEGWFVERLAKERGCHEDCLCYTLHKEPWPEMYYHGLPVVMWTFGYVEWKEQRADPDREDLIDSVRRFCHDCGIERRSHPYYPPYVFLRGRVYKLRGRYGVVLEGTF